MTALQKRIEFYVLGDLVSQLTVKGNSDTLLHLLHTVFENTIQSASATEISLTVRQLLQTENDVLLEFCLEDNGPNLRANSRGFKYYRSLARAKQIIADLKGKSEVMSIPGVKTILKFVIRFELDIEKDDAAITFDCSKLKGKRLLVAEDNEINQKAIAAILNKHGISFDIANHGKEAIELFERNNEAYDLILMDVQMPFMDGIQATNYIRKKLRSSVPVIALTTGGIGSEPLDGLEVGINRYITKPFTPEELISQLHHLLAPELSIRHRYEHTKIA